jgi:putative hydrolase of the HAD superfamily
LTKYKHIFFDLDHTLWDYDRNAAEVIEELFEETGIGLKYPHIEIENFVLAYHKANRKVWESYNQNMVTKQQLRNLRFNLVLEEFGVKDPQLAQVFEEGFFLRCPNKQHTFPHTHAALEYLSLKYQLHIITNGFDETQAQKMAASKIDKFFKQVVTSESIGYKKPDARIFEFAMQEAGALPEHSLMVGDNPETDIEGAKAMGMDQVLFDPNLQLNQKSSTFRISCLSELMLIC